MATDETETPLANEMQQDNHQPWLNAYINLKLIARLIAIELECAAEHYTEAMIASYWFLAFCSPELKERLKKETETITDFFLNKKPLNKLVFRDTMARVSDVIHESKYFALQKGYFGTDITKAVKELEDV